MIPHPGRADADLVRAAQNGDEDAFTALVVRHTPRLYRVVLHIVGNRADAEDCVQDAWVSAWRHLADYRAAATPSTWLYRVATNAALMRVRRRRPTLGLDGIPEPADGRAYGDPGRTPATLAVRRALAALKPEYRTAVVLREFEGLAYDEIAAVLDLSVPAVRNRLHRARLALIDLLEDR